MDKDLKKIKLLILDIDGILTDGTKVYNQEGMPFAKRYNDKDFTAIKRFRASGIQVCFLSGDDNVNKAMADKRNIDFFSARGIDKAEFIPQFVEKYKCSIDEMAYIGDDYFDLSIMEIVRFPFCPTEAPHDLIELCGGTFYNDTFNGIMKRSGADGMVAELYDMFIHVGGKKATHDEIMELDRKEQF